MRKRPELNLTAGVVLLCAILIISPMHSGAALFAIDSAQSQISLAGSIKGINFAPQGTGSLTATYQGNVNATLSGTTLQFTGSSTIAAIDSGNWQPGAGGVAGTAPADYGGEISILFFGTGYGAARNLVLDMTSPALAVSDGTFDSSQLTLTLVTNSDPVLDYNSAALGTGSTSLSGTAMNAVSGSSISTNGSVRQLKIQIHATLTEPDSTTLTLVGQIVATNAIILSPPEITGFISVGGNFVLTVTNAGAGSQLFSSTNLTTWNPSDATVTTNDGLVIFTIPMSRPGEFFRVQQ